MSRHQDRDDVVCTPVRFTKLQIDGTLEKTFEIREPFDPIASLRLGELIVWETASGPMVRLRIESDEWLKR